MDRTVSLAEADGDVVHTIKLRYTLGAIYRLQVNHGIGGLSDSESKDVAVAAATVEGARALVIEGVRGYHELKGTDPELITDQQAMFEAAPFAWDQLVQLAIRAFDKGAFSREYTPEEIAAGKALIASRGATPGAVSAPTRTAAESESTSSGD